MLYCTIWLILKLLSPAFSERRFTIELVSYSEESIPEYYEAITFKLLNNSRTGTRVLNGSAIFSRDLQQFDVTVKAIVNEKGSKKRWKLLDVTLDVCQLIGGGGRKRTSGIVYNILKNMRSFGHLVPAKCPFKKSEEYYIDHFYVDTEIFPPRVPYWTLNISFGLAQKNVIFYKSSTIVVVDEKKTKL